MTGVEYDITIPQAGYSYMSECLVDTKKTTKNPRMWYHIHRPKMQNPYRKSSSVERSKSIGPIALHRANIWGHVQSTWSNLLLPGCSTA